ncbi:REP-associated tyrosine transposase [Leptolyngbya subtilissima]|uniref:REP-associated tyrosine transposase n=1 Tax=Leptolyngbya subtilissima TaxID=1346803 RepID=UPI003D64DB02
MAKTESPFTTDAIVILPDHIHSIWTLPESDADFSSRWKRIKAWFSLWCLENYKQQQSTARLRKGEQAIWQQRFWEHQIRNETNFSQHVDYIHYNPVKHNLVSGPKDWPYSSFHRYVADGAYSVDWGTTQAVEFDEEIGRE